METNKLDIQNLHLARGYILIEDTQDSTSDFSTEHRKYDRKSTGIIRKTYRNPQEEILSEGYQVVFNDSNSISLTASGKSYEIIHEKDIIGYFGEEN